MIDAADDRELPAGQAGRDERAQHVELALLWHEATDRQQIAPRLKAERFDLVALHRRIGKLHAIGDDVARLAVFGHDQPLDAAADRDALIGKAHAEQFAGAQHGARCQPPFLAIIILAVMGDDHPQSHQPQQRRHQRRADAVHMHQCRAAHAGRDRADQGVQQRLEIGVADGP